MSFDEMLRTYPLEGRTLIAFFETADVSTLRFDLYNADDPQRCEDGMVYLLDVSVRREQFRIADYARERLLEVFSADILRAELADDELRLVADFTFYTKRERDVMTITLTGDTPKLNESPPVHTDYLQS